MSIDITQQAKIHGSTLRKHRRYFRIKETKAAILQFPINLKRRYSFHIYKFHSYLTLHTTVKDFHPKNLKKSSYYVVVYTHKVLSSIKIYFYVHTYNWHLTAQSLNSFGTL